MFSIQIDLPEDLTLNEIMDDAIAYDISVKLLNEKSTVGLPIYEFFGKFSNIESFCDNFGFPKENIVGIR